MTCISSEDKKKIQYRKKKCMFEVYSRLVGAARIIYLSENKNVTYIYVQSSVYVSRT